MSEMQRHPAEKDFRPFGLRPKIGHAALFFVHLEPPNFSHPSRLAWPILEQQHGSAISVNRS
jgi:hypothetical protein